MDHRASLKEVMAMPDEAFATLIKSLTEANAHSEVRLLRAKRTGEIGIAGRAVQQLWRHERARYKTEVDVYEDSEIDRLIAECAT